MLIEPDELERKAVELRAKLKDWELGYLCGLAEGEGSLSVYFDKRTERGYPAIHIANSNLYVLNYFKNKLNVGNIYIRKEEGNRKPIYIWYTYGKEGLIFLKLIFDGLFSCKKTKAALLFALNFNNKGAFAKKIRDRIKFLNSTEESVFLSESPRSNFSINSIRKFDLGILAGLLDSEGCIYIHRPINKGQLCVKIISTCPRIINKILNISQGWTLRINTRRKRRRISYMVELTNQNAKRFLGLTKDFLMIKKERAEIALEFIKTIGRPGTSNIPAEIKRRREELYWRLCALNVRGRIFSCGSVISFQPFSPRPPSLKWNFPRPLLSLDV